MIDSDATSKWKKSSFSGAVGNCVEINATVTGVRDSKNPGGGALALSRAGLAHFVDMTKTSSLSAAA